MFHQENDALGHSRALRGKAQIYLDAVRPLEAAALLADALDLLDPVAHRQESADLLVQLAENKLNFGFPDQARQLHQESLALRNEAKAMDIYLEARILLRTGKLLESQRLLESYNLDEPVSGQTRPMHFHREKQLLLSLLYVLQGDQKDAESYARQGILIGQKMHSEYVEAVAYMRLGHALQLDSYSPWGVQQRESVVRWLHLYDQPPKNPVRGNIHHFGIQTDHIDEVVQNLEAKGIVLKKGITDLGFWKYTMVHAPDDILIELFQVGKTKIPSSYADYFE